MQKIIAQPRRTLAIIVVSVLLLVAVLLLTPQGRTWAQSTLRFFESAESDTRPVETLVPGADNTPWHFNLSIAEAESQADFDVLEPTWLPEVLSFRGALFEPEHRIVRISYYFNKDGPDLESNGLTLTEQPMSQKTGNCEICDLVGASAEIETVQIGDITGEYVIGVWKAIGDTGQWGWVPEPYLQRLRWQANDIAFELLYMGIPEEVTKADLIAVAESLR